jgi:hypothetical protein
MIKAARCDPKGSSGWSPCELFGSTFRNRMILRFRVGGGSAGERGRRGGASTPYGGGVDHAAFFGTVAQVLPTLLVAVILEIRWLIDTANRGAWQAYQDYGQSTVDNEPLELRRHQRRQYALWVRRIRLSTVLYAITAMLFLVGELAACAELYVGRRDHGGALIAWAALIGLMLMAVAVPVAKGAIDLPRNPEGRGDAA